MAAFAQARDIGAPRAGQAPPAAARTCRILMLARYFPPEYSGAALQALSLARELRRRGHTIEFAVFGGRSGLDGAVDGFPVTRLAGGRGHKHQEFRLWWNLIRFLLRRRHDFDVLHSHGAYYTQAVVGPLGRWFGLRSVAKASLSHNDLEGVRSPLVRGLHRRMLATIDACVAISSDLEQEFLAAGVPARHIVRIPNGVDVERFRPATAAERAEARATLGLDPEQPVVLYAGVFDRRKNIEWLAERWVESGGLATAGFGAGGPGAGARVTGALLLAVGPGSRDLPDREIWPRVEALALANPTLLQVRGYVSPLETCYRAADALVLPSFCEGLPNVVLEAMASGLPCAVSAVSGTTDLIRDGETGATFAPGDPEALARALRHCLGPQGPALAQAARAAVTRQYGIPAIADAYEALYARMLRGNGVSA